MLLTKWRRFSTIVLAILGAYMVIRTGMDILTTRNKAPVTMYTTSPANTSTDYKKMKQDEGDDITLVGERNNLRLAKLEQTCALLKAIDRQTVSQPRIRATMNANHDVTWCRVNKAASTYTLSMFDKIFNTSHDQLLAITDKVRALPYSDMRKIIDNSYTFTFVREPYGRLFSTYGNKFYFPKDHWAPVAPRVVQMYRDKPSKDSMKYGHNITFYEMIRYTVEEFEAGHKLDEHLRPMHVHCFPCDYKYNFIGKLETIVSDWTYLKHEWAKKKQLHVPTGAGERTISFNETKHMKSTFAIIKDSTISTYKLYLRAWSYYKMLGYIYKHFDMPFKEESNINFDEFRRALVEAAAKSKPYAAETKQQKSEAVRQAYASIPSQLLERLRKVVLLDCMLYGYDDKPDWLFQHKNEHADYNYFQGLE